MHSFEPTKLNLDLSLVLHDLIWKRKNTPLYLFMVVHNSQALVTLKIQPSVNKDFLSMGNPCFFLSSLPH